MKTYLPLILILFFCITCSKDEKTEQFDLTTVVSPKGSGTVSTASGKFDSGKEISLTAVPAEGYVFVSWSGAVASTENPITVSINSNKNITAIFEKLDSDGDGVPDDTDECADTPSGEAVDAQGCSDSQKDTDGDGVNDSLDQCPDTNEGDQVDDTGCASGNNAGGETVEDADGDGVEDDVDECPDTPEDETADEQGCSESQKNTDADGDGVNDDADDCDDTPEGEDVDAQGCSESQKDSDGDGVNDNADDCDETPEGEDVDEKGCSDSQKDADGDGVNDDADDCDDTPAGETVDANGCSDSQKDTDNDGVNDDADECPETPEGEDVDENGCVPDLTTSVPDDAFEQRLIDLGIDDALDNEVLTASIAAVEDLSISEGFDIADLTGLEAFVSLQSLSIVGVRDNSFSFNLDNYPSLTRLDFESVTMKSVEIDGNTNLESISWLNLAAETVNITNTNSLTQIELEDARINALNIFGNTELTSFVDFDGRLENLTITDNTALKSIGLNSREINGLDFTNNAALESFGMAVLADVNYPLDFATSLNLKNIRVGGNDGRFLSIDVSDNELLENLDVSDSGLSALDVSNNTALIELNAEFNSTLSCIKVNATQLAAIPADWTKDAATIYATDCPE